MIESYVTSFVEGRVRLRHPIFKDSQIVEQVQGLLANLEGFESLKHNARAGSILLEYDAEVLDQETLLALLKQGEEWLNLNEHVVEPKQNKCCVRTCFSNMSTRDKRKLFNRSMGAALGVTALAIGVGNKRIHILAGSIFIGLSLWHMKRMHKSLL